MNANWIAVILLLVSAVLQACAGLGGGADPEGIRSIVAQMIDKPLQWLQTPEGQAYVQAMVQKYAPGPNWAFLGPAIATGASGLLVAIRALLTKESSADASRKRGDVWAEMAAIKETAALAASAAKEKKK